MQNFPYDATALNSIDYRRHHNDVIAKAIDQDQ